MVEPFYESGWCGAKLGCRRSRTITARIHSRADATLGEHCNQHDFDCFVVAQDKLELAPTSTAELVFHARKYKVNVGEYLNEAMPLIVLELGETFGNYRRLMARLIVNQEQTP